MTLRKFLGRTLGCWLALLSLYILLCYLIGESADNSRVYPWLAVIAAGIVLHWQRDKERLDSERLEQGIRLPIRYCLVYIAALYGFAKLIGAQFQTPLSTLDTPLGQLYGIQLAWRFFEYSPLYNYFIGGTQVLGSLLLLSRRTTTAGATLLAIVFLNIVLINWGFDIPVQLYATTFLGMSLYLLGEDYARLRAIFWTHEAVPARRHTPSVLQGEGLLRLTPRACSMLKIVSICLLYLIVIRTCLVIGAAKHQSNPVYGAWKIRIEDAATEVSLSEGDVERSVPWEDQVKVYFETGEWGAFRGAAGKLLYFRYTTYPKTQHLRLTFIDPARQPLELRYIRKDRNTMLLQGESNGTPFTMRLTLFNVEARP